MKPKTLVLIALLISIVYIGYLKVVGLNDLDFNNLFESIKPLIPHSIALMATFIFLVMAYLKQQTSNVVLAIVGIFTEYHDLCPAEFVHADSGGCFALYRLCDQ